MTTNPCNMPPQSSFEHRKTEFGTQFDAVVGFDKKKSGSMMEVKSCLKSRDTNFRIIEQWLHNGASELYESSEVGYELPSLRIRSRAIKLNLGSFRAHLSISFFMIFRSCPVAVIICKHSE